MSAPVDPLPVWAPTQQRIARVLTAYTRGGFDDDSDDFTGEEHGHFDETTSPTASEVDDYIANACDEVIGRTGVVIPTRCYKLATSVATWHVAMTVSGRKSPQRAEEGDSEVQTFTRNFAAGLLELQTQARMGAIRLS